MYFLRSVVGQGLLNHAGLLPGAVAVKDLLQLLLSGLQRVHPRVQLVDGAPKAATSTSMAVPVTQLAELTKSVEQQGAANVALLWQEGSASSVSLTQIGDANQASVSQLGVGNDAIITQIGNALGIAIDQMGGAQISVTQTR